MKVISNTIKPGDRTDTDKSVDTEKTMSLDDELNVLNRNESELTKSPSGMTFASEGSWHAFGLAKISLDDDNNDNITNQQMIDWFTEGVTTEDLDGYFTWQLYGWEEVDPTVEE